MSTARIPGHVPPPPETAFDRSYGTHRYTLGRTFGGYRTFTPAEGEPASGHHRKTLIRFAEDTVDHQRLNGPVKIRCKNGIHCVE